MARNRTAPGRVTRANDAAWVYAAARAFRDHVDASAPRMATSHLDALIEQGRVWLWDRGGPVSMAGRVRDLSGSAGVSMVYTPPEHRRRGYASQIVAEVSRHILADGKVGWLYTDLGNPTSNHIYAELGYEPVAVELEIWFDDA